MRTRKMRLMSFVLALAMLLAIAPVSAFAATSYVSNLHFNGDLPDFGDDYDDGDYVSTGNNWSWTGSGSSYKLNFDADFDPTAKDSDDQPVNVETTIPCEVRNRSGSILGGKFTNWVYNFSTIKGGVFEKVDGRNGSAISGENTWPIIRSYLENVSGTNIVRNTISNAIVWESFVDTGPTHVASGLFCSMPKDFTGTSKQVLCTITPVGYDDAVFQGEVYILGENQPNEFIVTATSKKFQNFEYDNDNVTVEPHDEKSIKVRTPL